MSFLRPTASSLSRSIATRGAEPAQQTVGPATAEVPPPPPRSRQLFGSNGTPDYSHVAARVDTGLHTRVGGSLPPSARTRTPASSNLQEFTAKCDSVMQRAQELLERTRDQEALVAKALEQRLSQSPARRATSQSSSGGGGWSFGSPPLSSPRVPQAPHTTPVASLRQMQEQRRSDTPDGTSPGPTEGRRSGLFGFLSPHRTPMPPPPPPPTPAATATTLPKPSLYERVQHSLRRLSDSLPPAPAPSPVPPTPQSRAGGGVATTAPPVSLSPARKSVRFVSPDKLESVTPTQRRLGLAQGLEVAHAEQPGKTEGELHVTFVDEAAAETETKSISQRKRTPPARSPSPRAKAPRHDEGVEEGEGKESSAPIPRSSIARRSSSSTPASSAKGARRRAAKKATAKPSHKAATTKAKARKGGRATKAPVAASDSRRSSSSTASSSASLATRERHLEMVEFIKGNTVKRSLAAFTKDELLECLRAEGVPIASPDQTKKKLLDELRGLLAVK